MNIPKESPDIKPLRTQDMRVTPDGSAVIAGGHLYKRVVLPSVAEARTDRETEEILEELEQED